MMDDKLKVIKRILFATGPVGEKDVLLAPGLLISTFTSDVSILWT